MTFPHLAATHPLGGVSLVVSDLRRQLDLPDLPLRQPALSPDRPLRDPQQRLVAGVDRWARAAWLAYAGLQPLARDWVKQALLLKQMGR